MAACARTPPSGSTRPSAILRPTPVSNAADSCEPNCSETTSSRTRRSGSYAFGNRPSASGVSSQTYAGLPAPPAGRTVPRCRTTPARSRVAKWARTPLLVRPTTLANSSTVRSPPQQRNHPPAGALQDLSILARPQTSPFLCTPFRHISKRTAVIQTNQVNI